MSPDRKNIVYRKLERAVSKLYTPLLKQKCTESGFSMYVSGPEAKKQNIENKLTL